MLRYCVPRQIFDKDEIVRLAENAQECRVVRRKDAVKIKVRRSRMLYTYVANTNEADDILNKISIEKVEL